MPAVSRNLAPAGLIGVASVVNVAAGIVLKEAGRASSAGLVVAGLGLAGILGIGQFLLWSRAHRLYPLSLTYPLTGLTFPIALLVAVLYQEPVRAVHVLATVLVSLGVIVVHKSQDPLQKPDA